MSHEGKQQTESSLQSNPPMSSQFDNDFAYPLLYAKYSRA